MPLILGIAGLVGFALYEAYLTSKPFIPVQIFYNRTTSTTYFGNVLQGLVLWCTLYYLPLYYEAVKGYSPIISGVALFPETFTVAPSAVIVGWLITYFGAYRWAIWSGWAISTLGLGVMCLIKVDTSIPAWVFINLISGLGLGFLLPSLTFAVQASVGSENLAIAVAMFSFLKALGQTLGVAVGGVVFQNQIRKNLLRYPALAPKADQYSQDASGLVQVIQKMEDSQNKEDLRTAYTDSLRMVWAVCCALCGLALLSSFLTESYDVDQALRTVQGIRTEGVHDAEEVVLSERKEDSAMETGRIVNPEPATFQDRPR